MLSWLSKILRWMYQRRKIKKTLLILPEVNKNVYLSARNLQRSEVMTASSLNTYKVLNADVLVVTENSLKTIDGILAK